MFCSLIVSLMASLWRRKDIKRYPFWYSCFTDANGRRVKKSTGLTSRSKALVFANKLQDAVDKARARTLTENRAREIISEIVASVHGGDGLRTYSVRKWFEHFCAIKSKSQDAKTAVKYDQIKREFFAFLGPKADLNILSITGADVRAFRDGHAHELSAKTLNDKIVILWSFFNGAWRANVISNNPCNEVEPVRDQVSETKRRKRPFTIEQVVALLKTGNDDWRGAIKLALYTGARLANCVNLRFRNLDFTSDPPLIVFEKYSKTGDEHAVPMHPALRDHLLSFKKKRGQIRGSGKIIALPAAKHDDDAFVFPSLGGRRVGVLSKEFRKLMTRARIENFKVREAGKGAARDTWALGFHSLRRTNVSILANAGVSEERRMAITAHKTRDVHKGYTHHERARLAEAIALMPSL